MDEVRYNQQVALRRPHPQLSNGEHDNQTRAWKGQLDTLPFVFNELRSPQGVSNMTPGG